MEFTDLGIEGTPSVAKVLSVAEDEAWQDLLLFNAFESQLQVLSWASIIGFNIVGEQTQHLHSVLHTDETGTDTSANSCHET